MIKNRFERVPAAVAAALAVLLVAACAIRLRGDEGETQSSASLAPKSDSSAAKLEQCRSVVYEQTDLLAECQKIWAERRRQFFRQTDSSGASSAGGLLLTPPKDESRLPSGYPAIQPQSE